MDQRPAGFPGILDPGAQEFRPQQNPRPALALLPSPQIYHPYPLPSSGMVGAGYQPQLPAQVRPSQTAAATRAVLLSLVPAHATEALVRAEMEAFGGVRAVQMGRAGEGMVTIHFYDVRDAQAAVVEMQEQHMRQQSRLGQHYSLVMGNWGNSASVLPVLPLAPMPGERGLVGGQAVWAQFAVPAVSAAEIPDWQNQGTLVVFNLDADVSSSEIKDIFEAFGRVKMDNGGWGGDGTITAHLSCFFLPLVSIHDPNLPYRIPVSFICMLVFVGARACEGIEGDAVEEAASVRGVLRRPPRSSSSIGGEWQGDSREAPRSRIQPPGRAGEEVLHGCRSCVASILELQYEQQQLLQEEPELPTAASVAATTTIAAEALRPFFRCFVPPAARSLPRQAFCYPARECLSIVSGQQQRGGNSSRARESVEEESQEEPHQMHAVAAEAIVVVRDDHPPILFVAEDQPSEEASRSQFSLQGRRYGGNKNDGDDKEHTQQIQVGPRFLVFSSLSIDRAKLLLNMLDNHCIHCNEKIAAGDDEEPFSAYDFVYLPIDFTNKCNVGYGFVNLTSTKAAWRLYKSFHSQPWEVFNSRKICEVTYARLQGLDVLKEHFKNSKFPCETDEYLPVVFSPPRDGKQLTEPVAVVGVATKARKAAGGPSRRKKKHEHQMDGGDSPTTTTTSNQVEGGNDEDHAEEEEEDEEEGNEVGGEDAARLHEVMLSSCSLSNEAQQQQPKAALSCAQYRLHWSNVSFVNVQVARYIFIMQSHLVAVK
ncbi:hypothetical protein ACLOJK_009222 [Asimina triloba]